MPWSETISRCQTLFCQQLFTILHIFLYMKYILTSQSLLLNISMLESPLPLCMLLILIAVMQLLYLYV